MWVADTGNNRVEEFKPTGEFVRAFGSEGPGDGQFKKPEGLAVDPEGDLWVADSGNDRVQRFTPEGSYLSQVGTSGNENGQFNKPEGISTESLGGIVAADTGNNRIQMWTPEHRFAHDTKTFYYSGGGQAGPSACEDHPEWAGLACRTEPVAQPDHGLPDLPVTTVSSYNIWDEAEATEEKYVNGSKTVVRKKIQTYDPAGRALTSEETAQNEKKEPVDTVLPKVTNEYNTSTGALEKQSTTEGTITSKDNTLGQLVESTDASGNVAKYVYEAGGDGRLLEESEGKGEEAKSSQAYVYNTTTGFMEKLVDSAAGTFTAGYDVEGNMTSEVYPNDMTVTYTINSVGQSTGLVYEKNADCASKCPETWFSDSIAPSIHGETLQQTSTLSKESYAYDNAGRLLETQETPAGKDCTTRLYAYEEESNRTSLTTREPGTEKCATEGGTVERHTYDEANRLTDEGVEYETLGNITKLPAVDAGNGKEAHELKSTYYLDGQVATQEQGEKKISYFYDPAGRTTETKTIVTEKGKEKVEPAIISHYAGQGAAITWTSEGAEKWTRNIPGIDGALDAIQESGKTPLLQLHDLQGDIVGTVADSESETKLFSTYNSTEFGVPTTSSPPKYSWLGADGVASELTSTGVSTQNGSSYVPEIGRPLQTGPIASPGSFPNGTGGAGIVEAPYLGAENGQLKEIALQNVAAEEETKAREAEELAKMNERPITETHVDGPGEGNCEVNCLTVIGEETGEFELEGEEEGGGGGGATVARAKYHPVAICKFQVVSESDAADDFLTISFSNTYTCRESVVINAAWNYVGWSVSAVYSSGVPVKGGAFFTEVFAAPAPIPQAYGLCVDFTYKGKTKTSCGDFGEI